MKGGTTMPTPFGLSKPSKLLKSRAPDDLLPTAPVAQEYPEPLLRTTYSNLKDPGEVPAHIPQLDMYEATQPVPSSDPSQGLRSLPEDGVIDVEQTILLLQELRKTATPDQLIALHKALLPVRSMGPAAPEANKSTALRERSLRDVGPRMRKSCAMPPGLATRAGGGDDPLRRLGDGIRSSKSTAGPRRKTISQCASSDSFFDAQERLAAPTLPTVGPTRSITPLSHSYTHTGVYRPGTLRIMNGAASPAPSIFEGKTPDELARDLTKQLTVAKTNAILQGADIPDLPAIPASVISEQMHKHDMRVNKASDVDALHDKHQTTEAKIQGHGQGRHRAAHLSQQYLADCEIFSPYDIETNVDNHISSERDLDKSDEDQMDAASFCSARSTLPKTTPWETPPASNEHNSGYDSDASFHIPAIDPVRAQHQSAFVPEMKQDKDENASVADSISMYTSQDTTTPRLRSNFDEITSAGDETVNAVQDSHLTHADSHQRHESPISGTPSPLGFFLPKPGAQTLDSPVISAQGAPSPSGSVTTISSTLNTPTGSRKGVGRERQTRKLKKAMPENLRKQMTHEPHEHQLHTRSASVNNLSTASLQHDRFPIAAVPNPYAESERQSKQRGIDPAPDVFVDEMRPGMDRSYDERYAPTAHDFVTQPLSSEGRGRSQAWNNMRERSKSHANLTTKHEAQDFSQMTDADSKPSLYDLDSQHEHWPLPADPQRSSLYIRESQLDLAEAIQRPGISQDVFTENSHRDKLNSAQRPGLMQRVIERAACSLPDVRPSEHAVAPANLSPLRLNRERRPSAGSPDASLGKAIDSDLPDRHEYNNLPQPCAASLRHYSPAVSHELSSSPAESCAGGHPIERTRANVSNTLQSRIQHDTGPNAYDMQYASQSAKLRESTLHLNRGIQAEDMSWPRTPATVADRRPIYEQQFAKGILETGSPPPLSLAIDAPGSQQPSQAPRDAQWLQTSSTPAPHPHPLPPPDEPDKAEQPPKVLAKTPVTLTSRYMAPREPYALPPLPSHPNRIMRVLNSGQAGQFSWQTSTLN
ncbi:hypothetical protein MRB53_039480 [Persea americana]|nr:hypothetical protein MRB53_039480 [Persea americana]